MAMSIGQRPKSIGKDSWQEAAGSKKTEDSRFKFKVQSSKFKVLEFKMMFSTAYCLPLILSLNELANQLVDELTNQRLERFGRFGLIFYV